MEATKERRPRGGGSRRRRQGIAGIETTTKTVGSRNAAAEAATKKVTEAGGAPKEAGEAPKEAGNTGDDDGKGTTTTTQTKEHTHTGVDVMH
jgi:hypothetical protein